MERETERQRARERERQRETDREREIVRQKRAHSTSGPDMNVVAAAATESRPPCIRATSD